MITIPHINGIISEENESLIPKNFVAKHSTGSDWLFFETIEEYNSFLKLITPNEIDTE